MTNIVKCPNCQKAIKWSKDSPYRPFCSERCKLIDLGAWADGSYAIPTNETVNPSDSQDEKNNDLREGFNHNSSNDDEDES